ncbi:hypothetical protein A4G26_20520 [Mycobacterium kansasii]|uniref:Pyridoxamine 5'-phosphate oxidase putative domain-containing protein n=1 Tax=Mycobacterium innocens TaxID=2341083 RepID=A0A498Q7T7_9MYCO|nr:MULTISPECIES: hypothetical protein [Mycobacterium]KZS50180.1 hypothetical protein A4G26_20520 [Mycobacterium kansasii]KZS76559.1 hypothetical protein A4G29_03320 [Mycobacterium kansasii]VBA40924.1 hypothetical protein LAUMK13_03299 [Mycobacterium innocens]
MPKQLYAVEGVSDGGQRALTIIRPFVNLLLRTPFAGSAGKHFMVLTFTGRKTGREYSIPISAHWLDDSLFVLTRMRWKNNFRNGATAEIYYDGKPMTMQGELIEDRAIVADLVYRCAESYGVRRAQLIIGLKFRDKRIPSVEEFAEAAERLKWAVVRFTPAD